MENGNGWKIGCLSALAVGCFLLGLAFNDCDPCQRVLFFFACVFLLFLVPQIVVAIITKIKDKQADVSDWRNEDSIGESVTTLKRESQDKTEDKSEVRKSFVTKEKLEEYLKAEKDERIKPFFENYIKCYDLIAKPFIHHYDLDHPDSDECLVLFVVQFTFFRIGMVKIVMMDKRLCNQMIATSSGYSV